MLLWTKICMLYWRNYVKSGCAIAGLHYIYKRIRPSNVFLTTCPVNRQVKIHSTHTFSIVLTSVHLYKTGSFVSKIITVALFEKN